MCIRDRLIRPWIETLGRLNNSFIVKRNVPVRQMLEVSKVLSTYIRHTITETKESIWIAQREGCLLYTSKLHTKVRLRFRLFGDNQQAGRIFIDTMNKSQSRIIEMCIRDSATETLYVISLSYDLPHLHRFRA